MPKIYALKLSCKSDEKHFLHLLAEASVETRHKVLGYRKKEDGYRRLFGEFLARHAVAREIGLSNKDIVFNYSPYGKPYLQGNDGVHFNISHSGNVVVCIIDEKPVGIDVEEILPVDVNDYRDYLSVEEWQLLTNAGVNLQSLFYEIWTLKESYIKQQGKGLSVLSKTFTINIVSEKKPFVSIGGERVGGIYFTRYDIEEGYKMAVCGERNDIERLITVSSEELAQK